MEGFLNPYKEQRANEERSRENPVCVCVGEHMGEGWGLVCRRKQGSSKEVAARKGTHFGNDFSTKEDQSGVMGHCQRKFLRV